MAEGVPLRAELVVFEVPHLPHFTFQLGRYVGSGGDVLQVAADRDVKRTLRRGLAAWRVWRHV
jgi:hypothetical protein